MFYPKFMAAVDFLCSDRVGKKKIMLQCSQQSEANKAK